MGGEKVTLTSDDQKRLERAMMASTEKLYDLDAAPAEMPGLDDIRRIIDDALSSACPKPWEVSAHAAQRVRDIFAPILAEKERLDFEVARLAIEADRNETGWNAAEARALAAEAALAGERERCAKIAIRVHDEVANDPSYVFGWEAACRRVAAAIRAGE